jgi:hypothetical protein
MSYQVVGQGQPLSKQRPGAVTAGVILLFVIAFMVLVRGALGIIEDLRFGDVIASGMFPGAESFSQLGTVAAIITAILYAVVAAGTVATGVLVGKGRGPARIVAWCLTGVMALCCGCQSLAGVVNTATLQGTDIGTGQTLTNIPTWISIPDTATAILIVLASLGAIVALSVPAANDFFRKEEQVWVPPTWTGQPGYAYQPGAPVAYPQPPQVPQYPYAPPPGPQAPPPSSGTPTPPSAPPAPPSALPAPPPVRPASPAGPMYPPPPTYPAPPAPPAPPTYPSYPPAQPFPPAQPIPPAQPFPPNQQYPPANEPPAPPAAPPADELPHRPAGESPYGPVNPN